MPQYTFPNQRTVQINRETARSGFLGIKNENWKAAARNLSAHSLKLYFYLASNADGYELALSPAAVRQEIGMARSTFHDQFNILVDKGYIVHEHGNTYAFYETPQPRHGVQASNETPADGLTLNEETTDEQAIKSAAPNGTQEKIEINNKYNKYTFDKKSFVF